MANSQVRTSAGTTFYVSNAPVATNFAGDAAAFGATSFTIVGELSDLGSFGKKYNLATFTPLADRKIIKRKGSYNNGTLALKFGASVTNPGQIRMQAASTEDLSSAFKVVTQSGSIYYFTGQVMGWMLEIGSVDQIMGASCDVEIDSDIIPVGLTA